MANSDKHVIDLWQQQASEGFRLTSEQIQMKLQSLEAKVRARTRLTFIISASLIVAFSEIAFFEHDFLMRLGCAASIVAVAFLAIQVHRNRFETADAQPMALASVEHLRNELQRQVDFHRGKRLWWSLLVLTPAGLLFFFAFARAHPEVIAIIRFEIAAFVLISLAAIPLNLRLARKYQRQIEEIDRQKEFT